MKPRPTTTLCQSRPFVSSASDSLPHSENWYNWHTDHPHLDEALLSGCASYRAFQRYLSGDDIYLLPRNKFELESILCVSFRRRPSLN